MIFTRIISSKHYLMLYNRFMRYSREIVHSPKNFEQWHFSHTLLKRQNFTLMEIKQGGYGVLDTDFWVERISKKGFTIVILTLSGKGRIVMEDDTEIIVGQGEAFISGPDGQGHREETLGPEPFEHIWMMLGPSSALIPYPDFDYRVLPINQVTLLRELIRMIIKEDLTGSDRDEAGLDQSERLFTHLVRRMLKPAAENTIVRSRSAQLADLWNKVSQHLENVWTVDDLCSIMNCSRSHLTRLCQEYYKQSPGEKVRAMKMEYAKILLSSSTSTIHEIAESVGFSRASLFSSSFAAYEGMSPREYRQASQGS